MLHKGATPYIFITLHDSLDARQWQVIVWLKVTLVIQAINLDL